MPSPRNPVAGPQDFRATAPYGTLILQDLKIPYFLGETIITNQNF